MNFQSDPHQILWRVHVRAPREVVYDFIATARGRSRFWAESAVEADGVIHFVFPDGTEHDARIVEQRPPESFALEYFQSVVTFQLIAAGDVGTEVIVRNERVPEDERTEVVAGWVSVLMQLKAAAQFGVDLRNHDRDRSWRAGYVEN